MDLTVSQLGDDDWTVLRELRLACLAESPGAFWATLETEAAYSQGQWTDFLRAAVWFIAASDSEYIGIAGAMARPDTADEPEIIGMWVAPYARRHKVGQRLLDACAEWGRARQVRSMTLWIVEGNLAAQGLYADCGFQLTGERAPLPRDEASYEVRMRLAL
jgi:RimJ/RimL family protein N-acetyltransferase